MGLPVGAVLQRADEAASAALAWKHRPWLDVAQEATKAGNGTYVWAGAGAGLLAAGRRGRRAALEGAAAMAVASGASNAFLKRVVQRRRPFPLRGRGPHKSTSSWPSSHAATGTAFAVAATLALPPAGLAMVPIAGLVATTRVYGRHHHVGDVLAGAAVGAAVGAFVHLVARRLHPPPRPTRPSEEPHVTS